MSMFLSVNRGRKGFLLLEVLVSVAVIAIGLVYVIKSFSSSSRAIETATNFLNSISFVEEKLWEYEALPAVNKGREHGTFARDKKYSWKSDIEGEKDIPINKIDLVIEWEERTRKQTITVSTYLWNKED